MSTSNTITSNLFPIRLEPRWPTVFRGYRSAYRQSPADGAIFAGKYVYSSVEGPMFPERKKADLKILKRFVRSNLVRLISTEAQFFDFKPRQLGASVAKSILYKENSYSIVRAFEMQVLYDESALYLAVLPLLRVHNRLRLPEVEKHVPLKTIRLPTRGVCFAGPAGSERWRDCKLLAFVGTDHCVVQIPSLDAASINLPKVRVIPWLSLTIIKSIAKKCDSRSSIDLKLKDLQRKKATRGRPSSGGSVEWLRQQYIQPLFPFTIGNSEVHLGDTAASSARLSTNLVKTNVKCETKSHGKKFTFENIVKGLQRTRQDSLDECPVAVFATEETAQQAMNMLRELNDPHRNFAGFKGMPAHFGVRLMPIAPTPFVVRHVEQYMDVAQDLVSSPDPKKMDALTIFILGEDQESFTDPVPLYYRLKALMARTGHASQVIEPLTLTTDMARWNLALNIAAKLGKIPWTLSESSVLKPVDLFLGFSYSWLRAEELGESRNIAYVNIFDQRGTWRVLCADASVFSFDQRLRVFPVLALESVKTATEEPEDLRMIEIHYNKRFGFREREAIAKGIRQIAPQASLLFVSIDSHHPVRFSVEGRPDLTPRRGFYADFSEGITYIQTTPGAKPVRINVYRDFCKVPQATADVARRMLALTRLNWRSVHDYSSEPVTTLYSSLVARLTNYFSFDEWNGFIDHRLKRTPWFL